MQLFSVAGKFTGIGPGTVPTKYLKQTTDCKMQILSTRL